MQCKVVDQTIYITQILCFVLFFCFPWSLFPLVLINFLKK